MADVARKYAQALFEVSTKHNVVEEVYTDFTEVYAALEDQMNYLKQIDHEPKVTINDRHKLVDKVFKGVNPFLFNTLKVVAGHRNFRLIDEIYEAFKESYNMHHGLAEAYLEMAQPLTEDELIQVKEALINRIGLKDLILHPNVNEALIGGIRVKIGTKVYDGSIQNDLNQLVRKFNRAH
ncbi:F0F1 ATP synthase subunit delta [Staphylococcus felis]|uniref:F0F1 ATP synthase subunit delta n=1 Tax=Staphylococcus felis TaxID=46127 RepID=UPI000CCFE159|nr:F0F1 ATP synthase subunit delta [Staphylococcus felis]AVP35478.1 F0F1 ATP synthase subunit delta [Staphylococcus felis]PNZ38133.1 F0F1 ATP synthase subunit delta [Staphylococcus felis]QQB02428.1 F0F1 ATP synthase subunit delta [Staphylococcus felis]